MERISSLTFVPGQTKSGYTNDRVVRLVSRTIARNASVRRSRRGRWMGNGMLVLLSWSLEYPQFIPLFQGPEGSDVGQRQRHSEDVLMSQRPQVEVLIFKVESEATKIITDLASYRVSHSLDKIVVDAGGAAQTL